MHDLAFLGFLAMLLLFGFRRPFIFVLGYVYVDIVSPQRLTYYLLNSVPVSLIFATLAVVSWAFVDDKRGTVFTFRQGLILLLLIYCGVTTTQADFPIEAADKWGWVWKTLAFAVFIPLTLRTRLRIEALALMIVLAASSIIVVGGIKTLASGGGGYGALNLMQSTNTGLYEGSIVSTAAIAFIPLILWLAKYGTIIRPDRKVWLYAAALTFACLLIPIGTQARTGLICIGVLAVTMLRNTKRRFLYLALMAAAVPVVVQMLPDSYTKRMDTIKGYKADQSASTRLAVWAWTLDYVKDHPFGGGFDAFRGNHLRIKTTHVTTEGGQQDVQARIDEDQARAYHSSYFEMLGEQGWIGLIIWLMIHFGGVFRMEIVRRRFRRDAEHEWIRQLAGNLQQSGLIYLTGSLFVGIAYQPFAYFIVALQIGLDRYAARLTARAAAAAPVGAAPRMAPARQRGRNAGPASGPDHEAYGL